MHLCKAHLSALFVLPRPVPVPTPYGWVGEESAAAGATLSRAGENFLRCVRRWPEL